MTVLDDRCAPAVPRSRAPRASSSAADLHALLVAESNRLLDATASSELSAQDALGYLVGALINALPAGEKAPSKRTLSKRCLVELVERTADRLGCPPAVVPVSRPRRGRGAR